MRMESLKVIKTTDQWQKTKHIDGQTVHKWEKNVCIERGKKNKEWPIFTLKTNKKLGYSVYRNIYMEVYILLRLCPALSCLLTLSTVLGKLVKPWPRVVWKRSMYIFGTQTAWFETIQLFMFMLMPLQSCA